MARWKIKPADHYFHLTPAEKEEYATLEIERFHTQNYLHTLVKRMKALASRHYTRDRYARLGKADRLMRNPYIREAPGKE